MTAPTAEPTAETVKAEVEAEVILERCPVGKKLIALWVKTYNKATMENWQTILGRGYMPYARHAAECQQCSDYTLSRRAGAQ